MMCGVALVGTLAAASIPFMAMTVFILILLKPRWFPRFKVILLGSVLLAAVTLTVVSVLHGSPLRNVRVCR